jgi:site-specific recombinase XerD
MTTAAKTTPEVALGPTLADLIDDYRRSLHAAGKSRATREVYTLAVQYLDAFLTEQGMPRQVNAIRREHIESWLVELRDKRRAPATVSVYYRSLQPFFKWAIEEGLVEESPLRNIARPKVPLQPVEVPTKVDIEKLLKACKPRNREDFEGYRDTAIVLLFATTYAHCTRARFGRRNVRKREVGTEGALRYRNARHPMRGQFDTGGVSTCPRAIPPRKLRNQ